jgi:hyaluronoglucosaminidase
MALVAVTQLPLLGVLAAAGSFDIAWNSPWPSYCPKGTVDPRPDFAKFGIRANRNSSFNGDIVTVIYCPTHFHTFPHFEVTASTGETRPVNGGIPQRGNLTTHLAQVRADVEDLFPDPNFGGYAVIDWEVWLPWLILASKSIWVNESLAYVRSQFPTWPEHQVEAEAIRSWNETSKAFMTETLKLCVQLRPRAKWGYYGRPGCYTGLEPTGSACIGSVQARNDALADLWAAGTALYPSVYIGPNPKYPAERTPRFVATEILETRRLRSKFALDAYPVVAYTWYDLFNGTDESNWLPMTNATDLSTEFDTPKAAGADGIIVWGAGKDASTVARCGNMARYFEKTLGPKLLAVGGRVWSASA